MAHLDSQDLVSAWLQGVGALRTGDAMKVEIFKLYLHLRTPVAQALRGRLAHASSPRLPTGPTSRRL